MHRTHAALITAFVLAACTTSAAQRQIQPPPSPTDGGSRPRPIEGFNCPANNLTSYTGVVTRYTREVGKTTLRIRTDWDTTENVTLTHPGTDDGSAMFRVNGAPFTAADWARIEQRKGVLVDKARAAAWVCSDGRVIVDWNAPKE